MLAWTLRKARQLAIGVIGITVALIGIVMIFTPGPALLVIPLGLGILATEFVWARKLLNHVKDRISKMNLKTETKNAEEQK